MPRHRKIDRPVKVEMQIPTSIYSKVKEQLFSEIEGRIPFGALSALGEQLFTDWLRGKGVEV